ncbi:HIPL1 protein-like [Papaver somniferum]|uniref:HIPL1 protein-like n=1 Tax=Papaver somniferum TaxID=3469 RepID=UPI000E6F728B|nr:HIPL1 protein-like [Papaver somniferum]
MNGRNCLLSIKSMGRLILILIEAPYAPKIPLGFCPNDESVCCDSNQDLEMKKVFQSMNISDPACGSLVKSIFCAKCNQFSADLFRNDSGTRMVPVLCTFSETSTLSKTSSFCSRVWNACKAEPILNSPFVSSLQGRTEVMVRSTPSKLTDICQSKSDFCRIFGGSSEDRLVCFNGSSASLHNTVNSRPPSGICLEQVTNGRYFHMDAHPDGSNRVFLASQQGKIWLATVPKEGNGEEIVIDESNLFVDLTDIVHVNIVHGLMSIAFHPRFVRNGRFFASYICDGENGLDVMEGVHEIRGNPSEVIRIFTMGIAFKNAIASQILFGPDGYLYLLTGDGETELSTYNLAQNKKSVLGKVLRFDVDKFSSAAELSKHSAWGNYSIPGDNPYIHEKESLPEIWALGFRHPWRCSFDSERSSYFLCGDSGKDQYEEVDIVMKGGNYGWPYFEGDFPFHSLNSSGGNTNMNSTNFISRVMGYDHSDANTNEGSSSIVGGFFYRSETDSCLYGKYIFLDLYRCAIWAGTENPENSGNFTSVKVPFSCAHNSPLQCKFEKTHPHLNLNYVFSMGSDNRKDIFLLTSKGVLRIAHPSRCNYKSSKEKFTTSQIPRHSPLSGSGTGDQYEDVDIVMKGGNYGCPYYFPFHSLNSSKGNNGMNPTNSISHVTGYDHSNANTKEGSSSIAGGFFYRSKTDPCLYGKYVFIDLYGFAIWAGTKNLENSGNFRSAKVPFSCVDNSVLQLLMKYVVVSIEKLHVHVCSERQYTQSESLRNAGKLIHGISLDHLKVARDRFPKREAEDEKLAAYQKRHRLQQTKLAAEDEIRSCDDSVALDSYADEVESVWEPVERKVKSYPPGTRNERLVRDDLRAECEDDNYLDEMYDDPDDHLEEIYDENSRDDSEEESEWSSTEDDDREDNSNSDEPDD